MQIQELLHLTSWIDENIIKKEVKEQYEALASILITNANPRYHPSSFKEKTDTLINTISSISTKNLTNEQEKILGKFNFLKNIGSRGVEQLEDVLFRNRLDIVTVAEEVNNIYEEVKAAIQSSNEIQINLIPLIEESEYEESHDVIMRVHFQNDVALKDISDFKKSAAIWYDITRGISMAHGYTPEDIRVVGAQKGSIIIELAVLPIIAATTSSIILSALKVADRVLEIRKKAEELKSLKLNNEKLANEVEKEAEKEKKEGLENITKELSATIKPSLDGDKINALNKSIRHLIDFVEGGGEVDFYAEEQENEVPEVELLRVNFAEIKRLEKRILTIENQN